MSATLKICRDDDDLAEHAARFIVQTITDAIHRRGRAMLALCGGTTPRKTYALLAQPAIGNRIEWARTYIFFGDERFVPASDSESNFGLLQRLLLAPISAPARNTFPVPTQLGTAAAAAGVYAETIRTVFGTRDAPEPPRFDLMLLGLGPDGHTASLFPGAASLSVKDRWVVAAPPGTLPPLVERITLTFPVLNAARDLLFLVSGANKAAALRTVLEDHPARERCPATGVTPVDGTLTWFVDTAAARELTRPARRGTMHP